MDFMITLVSAQVNLSENTVKDVQSFLNKLDYRCDNQINWLSQDIALEFLIDSTLTIEHAKNLREYLADKKIDTFCTPITNRKKKLFLADMDSTIVTSETLDELAEEAGIKEKIAGITERAMRGELDFFDAIRERVGLLAGLPIDAITRTIDKMETSKGADTLLKILNNNDVRCVLVSGGFTNFTNVVADQLGFYANHGNQLEFENGVMTGKVIEPILDKAAKLEYLNEYSAELNIDISNTVAIGDGANDLPMLAAAGLGIGYHPKPLLKDSLVNCIIHTDLTSVLYMQGYSAKT